MIWRDFIMINPAYKYNLKNTRLLVNKIMHLWHLPIRLLLDWNIILRFADYWLWLQWKILWGILIKFPILQLSKLKQNLFSFSTLFLAFIYAFHLSIYAFIILLLFFNLKLHITLNIQNYHLFYIIYCQYILLFVYKLYSLLLVYK